MNEQEYKKEIDAAVNGINKELAGTTMMLNMTLTEWLAVHGHLLLALRHPKNVGPVADMVKSIAADLGEALVQIGFISREAMDFANRYEKSQRPS